MSDKITQDIYHHCEYNSGGIQSIYILDMEDLQYFEFLDDKLYDTCYVQRIRWKGKVSPVTKIDVTTATLYDDKIDNSLYAKTLRTFVRNLSAQAFSELLKGTRRKYIVAYGTSTGRLFGFGYRMGATLNYSAVTNANGDSDGVNITFSETSIYPLFELAPDALEKPRPKSPCTWWEIQDEINDFCTGGNYSESILRRLSNITILDNTMTQANAWANFPEENVYDGYVTDDIRKAINQRTTPLELIFPDGTHINGACFQNVAKISKVTAPVCQYVGSSAFAGSSVTAFDTQGALVEIDKGAFTYCKSLKSIGTSFPNLKTINDGAFRYCQNTGFKLGNLPALEYIGSECFQESGIISIGNMPKLTAMKQTAFASTPIESVGDTPLLPVINPYAFWHCSKLKSFSNNTGATIVQNNAFNGCTSLENINMPKVTGITNNAFENCANLKTLTFPQLKKIEGKAFYGCDNIKSFDFGGSVTDGTGTVFSEIFTGTRTTVGTTPTFGSHFIQPSVNSDNDKVFNFNEYYWNTGYQTYKFKDGAYTLWELHKYPDIIPNYTNTKLTILDESISSAASWDIPENETFDGYTTNQFISQINANETIKQLDCPLVSELGIRAFQNLPNLDSIKIPNVKTIPALCFSGSLKNSDISFPSVTYIQGLHNNWNVGGFSGCLAKSITLESCQTLSFRGFAFCPNLISLHLGNSSDKPCYVTYLGNLANAFEGTDTQQIDLTLTGQWLKLGEIDCNIWTIGNFTVAFKSINGITANSLLSELSAQADNIVDNLHDIDQELHEKKEEIISDIYARTPMLIPLELDDDEEQEEQAPLYNNLYVLKKMIDELGEDEVKERLKKTIKDNL